MRSIPDKELSQLLSELAQLADMAAVGLDLAVKEDTSAATKPYDVILGGKFGVTFLKK